MPRHRLRLLPLLAALVWTALVARADGDADAAAGVVERLDIAVQAVVLEGPTLPFRDRYVRLARPVAQTHDLDGMTAARLGDLATGLTPETRHELKDLLFKRVAATYALRFDGAAEVRLARGPVEAAGGDAWVVVTRVTGPAGETTIRHRVVRTADGWRIATLLDEDPAQLDRERAEDARRLADGGPTALVEAWKARVPLPSGPEGEQPAAPRTPVEVVQRVQDELLRTMRDGRALGYRGRFERLAPMVDETHHLPGIAELAIRRHFGELDEAQRRRYLDRFRHLAIARYASRFDAYAGERFEMGEEQAQGRGRLVRSWLVKSDGGRIAFDWSLREVRGGWKILNITVDGVSDLAVKQAEYTSIFERQGFDALMATLEDSIRRLEPGG